MSLHLNGKCHCSQGLAIATRSLEYSQSQLKSVWYKTVQYLQNSGTQWVPPVSSSAVSLRKVLLVWLRDTVKRHSVALCWEQLKWNIGKLILSLFEYFTAFVQRNLMHFQFSNSAAILLRIFILTQTIALSADSDWHYRRQDQLFSSKGENFRLQVSRYPFKTWSHKVLSSF